MKKIYFVDFSYTYGQAYSSHKTEIVEIEYPITKEKILKELEQFMDRDAVIKKSYVINNIISL